ncbi:rhodanese-like domain-containing protein [Zobellella sp. DQSA1]|uniref:rhodanese-like domain-containing protein n=1 Tax=Zobellella sp. DQSA1 TaxID=3342386 RepID=UPI0035C12CF7
MKNWMTALLLCLSPLAWATEPVWIDVRSAEEYQQEHLAGAVHIPHTRIARGVTELYPDKNTPLNLYCRSGRRSQLALEALETLGYHQVVDHGPLETLKVNGMETRGTAVASLVSEP